MRFAVSLLSLRPGQIGGAETYVRRLLAALPAVAGGDELVAVMDADVARTLETPGLSRVVIPKGARRIVAERILEAFTPWRARAVERAFGEIGADAVLFPQQSIFPKRVEAPAVLTVVDVQHLFFPRYFGAFDRTFRPAIYPYSMRRARRIIAISEYTRRTLTERAGVPATKITAVPFGFTRSDAAAVQPLERLPRPYLYYPAATFPHKDHATLFRTYAALRRRGQVTEPLVLTGARTPLWKSLARLASELGMAEHIVHLGYLPFDEIRRVYAGASAILFPTRFEGFGLPVLEAAEFEKKVITSRLEVFDEIGVPRRFQIDFADPDQLLEALRAPGNTVLEKRPLAWEDNARATLEELRRAAAPVTALDAG
jgi:glycosyltransferase involved in cell wall biosynthesis